MNDTAKAEDAQSDVIYTNITLSSAEKKAFEMIT